MPPASRSADAPHSPPLGPSDDALRSVTLSGDPAYFALPPLGRGAVSRRVTVRGYVSGAADPLSQPGVPQTFRAIDVEGWATVAFGLIESALAAAAGAAVGGGEGDTPPLARLVDAKRALAAAIAAGAREVVSGAGEPASAVAALERALAASLTAGWAATGVVQLPMTVDAAFVDGGTHRLAVAPRPLPGPDGHAPPVVVSPGVLGLDAPSGTLDLVVAVADPQHRAHLRLDVELEAAGIEHLIDLDPPTSAGPSTQAGVGPWRASLDLPVPVRALPESPRVVAAEALASAVDDAPAPTLADTGAWTFRATFDVASIDQDELWLRTDWNEAPIAPPSEAASRSAADGPGPPVPAVLDPFAALAELVANAQAIRADLAGLVPGAEQSEPDAETRARGLGALTALAELAERLAATWGPIDPSDAAPDHGARTAPGSTATLRLGTIVTASVDGPGTVEGFVLRRAAGTPWGPEDRRPQLGYGEGDGLVVLDPVAVDGDPDALRYVPDPDRPAPRGERWTVALDYAGLSAVRTQSARAGARVVRNAVLVAGSETAPAFVSRSTEARAAAPVAPCRTVGESIVIGRGSMSDFGAALASALAVVTVPGRTLQSLAVRYGYRAASEQEQGAAGLDVLVPILLVPPFDDDTVPAQVADQVSVWCAQQAPATGTGHHLSLELRVFADTAPASAPLLTLSRLEYDLTS